MFFKLILPVSVFIFQIQLYANAQEIDTMVKCKVNAINFFNKNINTQSSIYNGIVYLPPVKATKGTVYFEDKNYLINGAIKYNGILHQNIPLLYDVFNDLMVAASPDRVNFILPVALVTDVYLDNHHFIYLKSNDLEGGFYDQLYNGNLQVLVKRIKHYSESLNSQHLEVYYTDEAIIYVKKGNVYFQIKNKASFFNLFIDNKKELKQYLAKNNIKFNNDPEKAVVALSTYYDQLNK